MVNPAQSAARKLRIQSVLYGNKREDLQSSLENLANAIRLAVMAGLLTDVELAFGDCSPQPVFTPKDIEAFQTKYWSFGIARITYDYFDENKGSAGGHNALLAKFDSDLVLILNPDTVVAPNIFPELLAPLSNPKIGLVEARQLPIEHGKDYDRATGETSWASTACALVTKDAIKQVIGFDAVSFFLYCDDVDFSWRIRLAGFKVVFQASAVIFHDKRLSQSGQWQSTAAEEYYSSEAALMLAHKYGRPDLVAQFRADLRQNGNENQRKAVAKFDKLEEQRQLPPPLEGASKVAMFLDGFYAKHRF
ncbi:glycosyltransferase [Chitinimonas koreensis]|uniref:glycosyltransferase n=1 Tax=Chitinimonas koreensis TaxID=356302 RepID=UPI00041ED65E|nr:glycosyltransferase family 2 protein [Chitinimonas koreensis]